MNMRCPLRREIAGWAIISRPRTTIHHGLSAERLWKVIQAIEHKWDQHLLRIWQINLFNLFNFSALSCNIARSGLIVIWVSLWQAVSYYVLGAFAESRKATVSFVMYVCPSIHPSIRPSARVEQSGCYWTNLDEIVHLRFFSKICRGKFKFRQNVTRITSTLHEYLSISVIKARWILLKREMLQMKVVEKIKTHILCSVTFSRKLYLLWDNLEKYGGAREATDDNVTRRKLYACFVTQDTRTNTQRYYVIFPAFPQQ